MYTNAAKYVTLLCKWHRVINILSEYDSPTFLKNWYQITEGCGLLQQGCSCHDVIQHMQSGVIV